MTVEDQLNIDVSSLENGIYILVLTDEDGDSLKKKFIISR
jgi:hypothetical protein